MANLGLGNITDYSGGIDRTAQYEKQQADKANAQAAIQKQQMLQQQNQQADRAVTAGQSLGTIDAGRMSPEEAAFNRDMVQIRNNQALQTSGKPGYDKWLQGDMESRYQKTPYFGRVQSAFAPVVPSYMGNTPPAMDEGLVIPSRTPRSY